MWVRRIGNKIVSWQGCMEVRPTDWFGVAMHMVKIVLQCDGGLARRSGKGKEEEGRALGSVKDGASSYRQGWKRRRHRCCKEGNDGNDVARVSMG